MVFCVECGTECRKEGVKFCYSCGAQLYLPSSSPSSPTPSPSPSNAKPPPVPSLPTGYKKGSKESSGPKSPKFTAYSNSSTTPPPPPQRRAAPEVPNRNTPSTTTATRSGPLPKINHSAPSSSAVEDHEIDSLAEALKGLDYSDTPPPAPVAPARKFIPVGQHPAAKSLGSSSPGATKSPPPVPAAPTPPPVRSNSSPKLNRSAPSPSVPIRPTNYNSSRDLRKDALSSSPSSAPSSAPSNLYGSASASQSSPNLFASASSPTSPPVPLRKRFQTQHDLTNLYKSIPTLSDSDEESNHNSSNNSSPGSPSNGVRQWKKKREEYDASNPDFAYTRHRALTVNPYAQAPEVLAATQPGGGQNNSSNEEEGGDGALKKVGSKIGTLVAAPKALIGKATDIPTPSMPSLPSIPSIPSIPLPSVKSLIASDSAMTPEEKERMKKQQEEEEKAKAEAEKRKQKEQAQKEDEYMKRVKRHRQGIFTIYGETELPVDLLEKSSHGVFNCKLIGSRDVEIKREKYVQYEIKVRWADVGWTIFRRYQQFHEFVVYLRKYSRVALTVPLPPKTYIIGQDEEERKAGLIKWLEHVVQQQSQFFDKEKNEKAEQVLIKFFAPIQMGDIKAPRLKLPFKIEL